MKLLTTLIAIFFTVFLTSCNRGPQPIRVGTDACDFCKMTIEDKRFGAELVTKKGKIYKFDDVHCILAFRKSTQVPATDAGNSYFVNFNEPHNLLDAGTAKLLKSGKLRSPMAGNIAAFPDQEQLDAANKNLAGDIVDWETLVK